MSPELRVAFKTVAASLRLGTPLPAPSDQLLALLSDEPPTPTVSGGGEFLLTVAHVAARLNVGNQWVYRNQGALGAVKVGGALRFPPASVEKYLELRSPSKRRARDR